MIFVWILFCLGSCRMDYQHEAIRQDLRLVTENQILIDRHLKRMEVGR